MNLGLENERKSRKRTYNELAMMSTLNTNANTIDQAENKVNCDSDQRPEILLQGLLGQFDAELSFRDTHISQHQVRIQREISAKMLNNMQKLLLEPLIRSDVAVDDYALRGYREIRVTLEFLIDRWGIGDIQTYNVLIETLLQSYMITPRIGKNVKVQEIILLDLLPYATGGESENCLHLQSAIAKVLMQALSKCGRNSSMYKPIISWCKWYLNFYQYQKPYRILRNEDLTNNNATASLPIPAEIHRLGIELLRTVPSVDQIPSALCINLDFVAFNMRSESIHTLTLQQHSKELIVALRRRWAALFLSRDLTKETVDCTRMSEEKRILECKRQLLNLFEIAIFDKDINQAHLLIDTYIKLLQTMMSKCDRERSESQFYGTHKQITEQKANCDSSNSNTCDIDGNVKILTIDWIFVMMLFSSTRHQTLAIEIVDTWIISETCDSLLEVIKIVFLNDEFTDFPLQLPNNLLHTINHKYTEQRLIPCLLKTAYVLLLKPQRDYLSHSVRPSAGKLMQFGSDSPAFENRFILSLCVHLDFHYQKELINMLLHITDECLVYNRLQVLDLLQDASKFSNTEKTQSSASIIIGSVFDILHDVTQINPLRIHLKSMLIERLILPGLDDTPSPSNIFVDRRICSLLVSLLKPITTNENFGIENGCTRSEALIVLQNLLFAEASQSNATRAIRGIFLATELMSTKHCCIISIEDRKLIHEWVLRLLLPCTRRMIEPELGLAGLSFFNGCLYAHSNENVSTKESLFFQHIKMLVANTGLVQILDIYRGAGNVKMSTVASHYVLAYSSSFIDSSPTNTVQENPRAMLFGMNFFLRRSNEITINPTRWLPTADWVYMLMDTYLQIGRTRVSKSWNPMKWLRAPLEFPTIDTSFFNLSNKTQSLIVQFIDQKLCQFELSKGIQDNHSFPGSYADLVVRRLYSKKLKAFIDSLRYFAVALLIGIFLSSAVLKNAYEHSQTTNSTSLGLHNYIILQIIKIYDLRAKSTTMDSIFLAIDSALRRSWIRKKKVKVVLSDDSSDSGNNPGLSLARRNKDIEILNNLSTILKAASYLREMVFASTKYIGSKVLWSALKNVSDSETIRKSLDSLMFFKADELVLESVMKLSYTVGTKLHIIHQILKQLESSSPSHSDSTKSNIQYCFVEISFFIPWLAKLRKRCAEAKRKENELIISHMDKSLALLVRVTSSYLQVIAIFLQRVHRSSHFHGNRDMCILSDRSFNDHFFDFDTFQSSKSESDITSTTIRRLFNFFADHLRSTEYAVIADSILEILSVIATFDDDLTIKLADLSWVHLQTVYVYTEANIYSDLLCCPLAVTFSVSEVVRLSHPIDHQSNARIVKGILQKLLKSGNCYDSQYLYLHFGMIRHWGLLIAAGDVGFHRLLLNLTALVSTLKSFLESVNISVTRKTDSDERGTSYTQKQQTLEPPRIVGLDVATFPEFFETLLNLVIATTGALTSGSQKSNRPTNICQRVLECVAIFRNLIDTYKDHMNFFSCKSALTICCGSKDLLLIAVRQSQHFVDCRMDRSSKQETKGIHEAGNVVNLEEFTHRLLSHVGSPLLSLCDLWETSTAVLKKSKLLSLRLAVERATRLITDISRSRTSSISNLSFGIERDKLEVIGPNKGFQMYSHNTTNGEQSLFVPFDDYNAADCELPDNSTIKFENIHVDDNDNTFEVVGLWGNGSNVDDQSDSICSLNIENHVSKIFHTKQSSPFVSS